jgi:hypothetical protein
MPEAWTYERWAEELYNTRARAVLERQYAAYASEADALAESQGNIEHRFRHNGGTGYAIARCYASAKRGANYEQRFWIKLALERYDQNPDGGYDADRTGNARRLLDAVRADHLVREEPQLKTFCTYARDLPFTTHEDAAAYARELTRLTTIPFRVSRSAVGCVIALDTRAVKVRQR